MNLKQVFEAITPENIKDIPLLSTAMDIFITNLEKNSNISIDIHKLYDNVLTEGSTDISESSKTTLKDALLSTYLSELYRSINNAQRDKQVQRKYEDIGIVDAPINSDAVKILNKEYFRTNKQVKENVGTTSGIKYFYELSKYLEDNQESLNFTITEDKPFHIVIDGSITSELYNKVVANLAHPLGFTYAYRQVIGDSISDFFGLIITYDVQNIEVRELNGSFDVFTGDADDTNVKLDFISRGYSSASYDAAIISGDIVVHLNKIPLTIEDNVDNSGTKIVTFTDLTVLTQTTSPVTVTYKDNVGADIKLFVGHFSLYLLYTNIFNTDYTDTISFSSTSSEADVYDVTNVSNVTDDIVFDNQYTGNYFFSTDNFYFVTEVDGDASDDFYFYGS